MSKSNAFWKKQIKAAMSEHKNFFKDAKACNEAYSKERSYNIFYSNTQVLNANLLPNMPKPDIQRRFLKKTEKDKLRYNTYLEVAKVAEGCVQYYSDIGNFILGYKDSVCKSIKVGRGVSWVEYTPNIQQDEQGNKFIKDRDISLISLNYDEFLVSSAEKESDVWWVARRHLLTKEDVESRFDYEFSEDGREFNYQPDNGISQTSQDRAEVWEIWDKSEKMRHFVMMNSTRDETLESIKDPYKLQNFFPCDFFHWLDNGNNIIPIPEYKMYRQKALELDNMSKLSDNLERAIKYVVTTNSANRDNVSTIENAEEGAVIELKQTNPVDGEPVQAAASMIPVDGAISLAAHREVKKQTLKNDIFEITGISDLMRGVSETGETATAQKIKGVFGSLRFQDRQKKVQEHIKKVTQIVTEIICEHWDAETMSDITCTRLPTEEEKSNIQFRLNQINIINNNPEFSQMAQTGQIPMPQVTNDEINELDDPTWNDVLKIMRRDKLRNYTIEIETSATAFDDMTQQTASITALNNTYQEVIRSAVSMQDSSVIKGYIPIAKMMLTQIKTGRALAKQIIEALETAARDIEKAEFDASQNQAPNIEMMKLQLDMEKEKSLADERNLKAQSDLLNQQNKSRELALKEIEAQARMSMAATKVSQDGTKIAADIAQGNRGLDIDQQEANRKDRELTTQTLLRGEQLRRDVEINPNLAGDVGSLL